MHVNRIAIRAAEHRSANEAIQHLDASGDDRAILFDGRYLTVRQTKIEKIGESGVEFAYLVAHHGKIMTIPAGGR